jgi:CRP/FNR family transcriptional regulator, dissimilatory nitrate respiration regulator
MSDSDREIFEGLFGRGPMRKLARDEPLFRQGEPAAAVFLIVRGRLRMVRNLASGDRMTIHTGRAGELFAEGALFSDVYQCDAIAAEPAEVRACGKTELRATIGESPSTMLALFEKVTHLLHHARAMRELRNIRSAGHRAMQHLYLSASKDDVVVFDRPLSEVAEDLGLTHEAYYRSLAALARAGRFKRTGRIISLSSRMRQKEVNQHDANVRYVDRNDARVRTDRCACARFFNSWDSGQHQISPFVMLRTL